MNIKVPAKCRIDVRGSGWAVMLPANRPVSRRTALRLVRFDDGIEYFERRSRGAATAIASTRAGRDNHDARRPGIKRQARRKTAR